MLGKFGETLLVERSAHTPEGRVFDPSGLPRRRSRPSPGGFRLVRKKDDPGRLLPGRDRPTFPSAGLTMEADGRHCGFPDAGDSLG